MTVSISGTGGVTFPDNSVQATAATGFGFKNRILNGQMVIDQRNAGAAYTNLDAYGLDRWRLQRGNASSSPTFNVQQSTTVPPNYKNSQLITVGTAGAPGASNYSGLRYNIEGLNVSDFGWGSITAATITLSFWVNCSVAGTYGIAVQNSANDRSYIASYTVSVANTWEQKSITVLGDTSGTWLTTNGIGLLLQWDLGVGTGQSTTAGTWQAGNYLGLTGGTKLSATAGATFYITGVQLEKGSTATAFDYRPYGTELALCQRYAQVYGSGVAYERLGGGLGVGALAVNFTFPLNVTMRASPSVSSTGSYAVYNGTAVTAGTTFSIDAASISVLAILLATTGIAAGGAYQVLNNNSPTSRFTLSAEL
jgi:hypothetical protein